MRAALIIASLLLSAGCAHPIPDPDPNQAWVDLAPTQDTRLEALAVDSMRLEDDRYFQFEPGSRQLEMRYRFDVAGHDVGAGSAPLPRDCRLSLAYDRFSAGERYRLVAGRYGFRPWAKLYDEKNFLLARAEERGCGDVSGL